LNLGLEFLTEHLPWKRLPDEVFEKLGGRACAKLMRDIREGSSSTSSSATVGAATPGSVKKKRSAEEMIGGLQTPIKGEGTGRVEETPVGTDGEVPATPSAVDQQDGVLATPSQAIQSLQQTEADGADKKTPAASTTLPTGTGTTGKRRKVVTAEGMTSLGRSVAYTSHAEIETNKNIVKLLPGKLLSQEQLHSSGHGGSSAAPPTGSVPVPGGCQVSWKVIEVRL
jgi:hypothetical protein